MKNLTALAALGTVAGILTASCSGGHGASTLPPASSALAPSAGAPSTMGARTIRPKSALVAPAGWAATGTGAVAPANATDLGPLPAGKTVDVTLALQMRDPDGAKAAVAAGRRLSRAAFVSQYAPSQSQVSAAVSYLQSQGFTNVVAAPNNMLVTATASAAAVQKAFNTSLHGFSVSGKSYFANTQPAFVPTALGGNVVAVLGLTNVPGLRAHPAVQQISGVRPGSFGANGTPQPTGCTEGVNTTTGAPVCPRWYDPATFSIAYDVGGTAPATNTEVAI